MVWYGTKSADRFSGETGEHLFGIKGDDILFGNLLNGGSGEDKLFGKDTDDIIKGGSGNDYLSGLEGNDTLLGNRGNDLLLGFSGSDFLRGGSGNDTLNGGEGVNTLYGQSGNDVLYNGWGLLSSDSQSFLYGGEGSDTFALKKGITSLLYENSPYKPYQTTIKDFDIGKGDKISLYELNVDYNFVSNGNNTDIYVDFKDQTIPLATVNNATVSEVINSIEWTSIILD